MNPDNPYAAPQTIEPQLDLQLLPLAELQAPRGKRRLFPEWSTARLKRLVDVSKPLEIMLVLWMLIWFFSIPGLMLLHDQALRYGELLIWIIIALNTGRMICSFWRTKLGRWYMLLADALLIVACHVGIVTTFFIAWPSLDLAAKLFLNGVIILVLVTIIVLAYQSCITLLKARELFEPVCLQHDDLTRELAYRKEHGIE